MALDISIFASLNTTLIFTIGVGIILLVIAILYRVDYQLRKKRALQESTLEYRYSLRFEELKKERVEPKEFIEHAEKIGRDFIEEKFEVNSKADFSQLMDLFKDKGKPYVVSFCQTMLELLYSGEKPGITDARTVLNSLEMMLKQEGALIILKDKEKPTEETNMLTNLAKRIQKSMSEKKEANVNQSVSNGNAQKDKPADKKEETISEAGINSVSLAPIPKKEIILDKQDKGTGKKERKEYKYIESIDTLDRIKHRVKKHQEEKQKEN